MLNYIKNKIKHKYKIGKDVFQEMVLLEVENKELKKDNHHIVARLDEVSMELDRHIDGKAKEDIEEYIKLELLQAEKFLISRRKSFLQDNIDELYVVERMVDEHIASIDRDFDKHYKLMSSTYNHEGFLIDLGRDYSEIIERYNNILKDDKSHDELNVSKLDELIEENKFLKESNDTLKHMEYMSKKALDGELGERIASDLNAYKNVKENELEISLLEEEKYFLTKNLEKVSERILSLENYNESLISSYSKDIGKLKDTVYIKPSYLECPKCNKNSSGNIDEGEEDCSVCLGAGEIRISYRERRQREKLSEIMKEDFRAMERKTYL